MRAWGGEGVDPRRLRRACAAVARAARLRHADVGEGDRRAHQPPPAVPRADPARGEGRRAGALEARRRRRLRARPAARGDLARADPRRGRRPAHHAARRARPLRGPLRPAGGLGRGVRRDGPLPRGPHARRPRRPGAGRPPRRARPSRSTDAPRPSAAYAWASGSERGERAQQVVGQRRPDPHRLARHRVGERELGRVQERSADPGIGPAVHRVTEHRMADGGEVHADLVGATGLERATDRRAVSS